MEKVIYALGFFDGVHLGHQALLTACRSLAEASDSLSGVVTFESHPDTLVTGRTPALINTPGDRAWMLREIFGMDRVLSLIFDRKLMEQPWEEFLEDLLRGQSAAGFVCGEDFRFGYRGRGTAALLEQWCRDRALPCTVVPEQYRKGVRISSTGIRELLETGEMASAVAFLGHPHYLRGTVIHGQGLGHRLGMPTANLALGPGLAVPKKGVYCCRVTVDGVRYPAVTNVGSRPTVGGRGVSVEPWILGYQGDLYGRDLILEFYFFLRPELKFDSLEALTAQIRKDADATIQYFEML